MQLSDINEAMIRREAGSPEVFGRGEDYARRGAVEGLTLRGDTLTSEVEGSDYEPYQVTVRLGKSRIESADCTCPYGEQWDGWCKHIVATLVIATRMPDRVEKAAPLSDLLDQMDHDALKALLLRLAERDPHLAHTIATEAENPPEPEPGEDSPKKERVLFPIVDADAIRRQIKGSIRSLNRMRSSEAYWHVGAMVKEIIDGPIHAAEIRLAKGDARGALLTLEAVMDAYLADWEDLDGSDGETPDPFYEAGKIAAEALLTAEDFTENERQGWVRKFTGWQNEVDDYGVDDAFSAAITAAEHGWNDPSLQRVLRGTSDFLSWDNEASSTLPEIFLNVLEKRGQNEEALHLALATGRLARATTILVRLGRVEETIRLAAARATSPALARMIATALEESDEMDIAMTVAEMGLNLPKGEEERGHGGLALWLRDAAEAANRPELARRAAVVAVRELPSLNSWIRAEQMVLPSDWPDLRDEFLENLHEINVASTYNRSDLTPIFLHENRIDDALHSVRGYGDHEWKAQVADAALTERPDAVLTMSRREAESIMDEGKSGSYETARDWLRRCKTALINLGRAEEWPPYRDELLEKHRRRYKWFR